MARYEAVIIGAGHAALSTSYCLTQAGIEHVVLERGQIAEKWRSTCWDSFYLNTPNWACALPGYPYDGDEPDAFFSLDEAVGYLEGYARRFGAPVRTGVEVLRVTRASDRFIVTAEDELYEAAAVIVASGFFARPRIPVSAAALASDIAQVHSSAYKNPGELPPGAVLVVGSAQSGLQIAEDLFEAGRDVYLSTSRTGRFPRRYRGKDIVFWAIEAGILSVPVERLPTPDAKFAASRAVSGTHGGHTTNLHEFSRRGMKLLGHYSSGSGYRLQIAPDLHANLAATDEMARKLTDQIDEYIERAGLDVPARSPENTDDYAGDDGFSAPETPELDLRAAGIRSIVWASGFHWEYPFVDLPVFDGTGYPLQQRGVSPIPGLYFMGVHFQHTAMSDLFVGVGKDAHYVSDSLERYLGERPV